MTSTLQWFASGSSGGRRVEAAFDRRGPYSNGSGGVAVAARPRAVRVGGSKGPGGGALTVAPPARVAFPADVTAP